MNSREMDFQFDDCFYPGSSDHELSSSSSDEIIPIGELELVRIPYDKNPLYQKPEAKSEDSDEINIQLLTKKEEFIQSIEKMMRDELERTQGISPLLSQVLIGMARDFIWALFTYRNTDYFNGKLGAFWGPTLTQTIGAFLPTFSVIKVTTNIYNAFFLENKKNWLKTQAALALASWSSILFWNGAQTLSQMAGEKWFGWNSKTAGFTSGFLTGITETIWQNAILIPYLLNQPLEPLEILFNTLGGAMWQWVYQANLSVAQSDEKNISLQEVAAAAELAAAVAASTLLMTLLARKIKASFPKETSIEMKSIVEEQNPVSVSQKKNEKTHLLAHSLFHRSSAIDINTHPVEQDKTKRYSWLQGSL